MTQIALVAGLRPCQPAELADGVDVAQVVVCGAGHDHLGGAALRAACSTTKEPRKPAPPVTITRLSRQNWLLSGQRWIGHVGTCLMNLESSRKGDNSRWLTQRRYDMELTQRRKGAKIHGSSHKAANDTRIFLFCVLGGLT